ncbi:ATP-binding protein [Pseudenhygromyxa sp. WMMC2535]|uniref:AAA family ATPase n=1 Tax=Pseudenhygromyxa sp. WMMC2535 TaxID=2712867 RepID=UPI001555ABA1|nr:ATP-binding protein [Pseudenhygromyxa sp. WMMC2535]NVB41329.1 ATP-binding protein [Pseudenhygromyxa sp. WMMC2535]
MIKRLEIENYGCIRRAEIKPTPLHALVGPSDVGKSTFLKAVQALSRFISLEIDGRQAPLIPAKARDTVSLTAEFAGSLGFNVGFAPRSRTLETYIRESMQGEWLGYRHITPDFQWASEIPAPVAGFAEQIRGRLDCRQLHLHNSALCRDSPLLAEGAPVLFDEEGHGLAGVYDRILARSDDAFDRVTQRLRGLFPWIGGIEVNTISPVTKNLFVRTLDGQRVPALDVGVGVMRMLAWEALRFADRPRLLLIEEPEAGLSPALVREVMRLLRDLTVDARNPTQVLIATRSPLVVAELDPQEVTLVTRHPSEGTRVSALADAPAEYLAPALRLPRGLRWLDLADGLMQPGS